MVFWERRGVPARRKMLEHNLRNRHRVPWRQSWARQARKRQEILQREANERMANMKGGWQGSGGSTIGGNDGQKSLAEIQREEEERRQREMAAKNEELLGMPQNAIGTAWATGKLASSSNPPPPQQQQPPPPKRPTMMMPRQMQGSQRKVQSDFDRPDSAGSAPRSNPGSHNNSIADNMNQIDGDSWGAPRREEQARVATMVQTRDENIERIEDLL